MDKKRETKRIVFSNSEKGQDVREEILAGTLDDKLEGTEIPSLPKLYNDSRKKVTQYSQVSVH